MALQRWTKDMSLDVRCDFNLTNGSRCSNLAEPSVSRCMLHGANRQLQAIENKSTRIYRLAKIQKRHSELSEHDRLKSLREEVGLLRLLIEEKVNAATDMTDLMIMAGPISDMVCKVQKLVESCERMEHRSDSVLDRTKVQNLASALMQCTADSINDFADVHDISDEDVSVLIKAIADSFLKVLKDE